MSERTACIGNAYVIVVINSVQPGIVHPSACSALSKQFVHIKTPSWKGLYSVQSALLDHGPIVKKYSIVMDLIVFLKCYCYYTCASVSPSLSLGAV